MISSKQALPLLLCCKAQQLTVKWLKIFPSLNNSDLWHFPVWGVRGRRRRVWRQSPRRLRHRGFWWSWGWGTANVRHTVAAAWLQKKQHIPGSGCSPPAWWSPSEAGPAGWAFQEAPAGWSLHRLWTCGRADAAAATPCWSPPLLLEPAVVYCPVPATDWTSRLELLLTLRRWWLPREQVGENVSNSNGSDPLQSATSIDLWSCESAGYQSCQFRT